MNHLKFTHPDTYKIVCDSNKAVTTTNEVAKAEKASEQASSSNTLSEINIAGSSIPHLYYKLECDS